MFGNNNGLTAICALANGNFFGFFLATQRLDDG